MPSADTSPPSEQARPGYDGAAVAVGGHASGSNVSRAGPCNGGSGLNAAGRNIPGTNQYVFPCVFGGTETTRLPTT